MKISPNFKRSEFACKCGCGYDTVDHELIEILEITRGRYDTPIIITSGCRCITHNEKIQLESNPDYVSYSSNSQHLYGRAADIKIHGVDTSRVYNFINRHAPNKLGLGLYSSWVHVDTRTNGPARW